MTDKPFYYEVGLHGFRLTEEKPHGALDVTYTIASADYDGQPHGYSVYWRKWDTKTDEVLDDADADFRTFEEADAAASKVADHLGVDVDVYSVPYNTEIESTPLAEQWFAGKSQELRLP
jgi:hypothetical protein